MFLGATSDEKFDECAMNNITHRAGAHAHVGSHEHLPLALRREALLAECALQRLSLAAETRNLLMPFTRDRLRVSIGSRLKIPLMIAGAVLGVAMTRPRRAMPALLRAASLLKNARVFLPVVRRIAARIRK
jgi:hypothetical protein